MDVNPLEVLELSPRELWPFTVVVIAFFAAWLLKFLKVDVPFAESQRKMMETVGQQSHVTAQGMSALAQQGEETHKLITDLCELHADPTSPFATVRIVRCLRIALEMIGENDWEHADLYARRMQDVFADES